MGVIISQFFKIKEDIVENPKMTNLTPEQIQIIKRNWEVPKANLMDSGEAILLKFLEKYPANQDKFEAFKNVPLLSLKGTPGFRTHALRIMTVFQNAMDAFDEDDPMDRLNKIWTPVAASHARRHVSKQSFNQLREIILETMSAICDLNDTEKQAWITLFDNIYSIVFPKLED